MHWDQNRLPVSQHMKKLLLIATMCSFATGALLPEEAAAMLPVGNDAHRHFYKDQEWIWTTPQKTAVSVGPNLHSAPAPTLAFTMSTNPPQTGLAFTMPTHPPQGGLAFTMPTHPPQGSLAFTMPTHPPQGGLAFTMPTQPPQGWLAFPLPTHP